MQSVLRFTYFFLSIIVMCLLFSCSSGPCSSKTYFLDSMDSFVNHIGEIKDDIDEDEWEIQDNEFKVFTDECYPKFKSELTSDESTKYKKLMLKYEGYKASDELSDFLKKGAKVLGDLFGTELDGVDEQVGDFIEKFKDGGEINDAIKNIQIELEDGGDLKEALDELKVKFEDDGEFRQMMEELKEEFNNGELKEMLEDMQVDLQEAGEDIKEALEEAARENRK